MLSPESAHQSLKLTGEPIRLEGWFRIPKPVHGSDQAAEGGGWVDKLGLRRATGMHTLPLSLSLSLSSEFLSLLGNYECHLAFTKPPSLGNSKTYEKSFR